MNILFTHSYFLNFDKKQFNQKKPYPPLATIQAAAIIRDNGHKVSLFDTNFAFNQNELLPIIKTAKPDVLVIYDDGFNYLTKMCLTNMRDAALDMIKMAKGHDIHVIISSSDSTDHYKMYLDVGADEVILGEGDETLNELIECLVAQKNSSSIKGIAYKELEDVIVTEKRPVLTALDELPLPAWDLIKVELYQKAWEIHGYFSINIATTRGCPYKCNWCAKPIYGVRYNSRSPQHVIKEIKLIQITLFS